MGIRQMLLGGEARNVPKGTSYVAQGLAQSPEPNIELGSAGIVPFREVVPELATPFQRSLVYGKMMNDAGVDVSMRTVKTPVLGADFYIDPYSDSDVDTEISEFIWDNLASGMSAPLLNSMEDILHFCEDGYSVVEKVHELREWTPHRAGANTRQYTMLRKLAVRPVNTVSLIEYDDNGGPVQITQQAIKGDGTVNEVTIPINKLLIFTLNRKGGDLTGKSLLRTAYPHWYYKSHFYKIDAIQKERHGIGVPRGKLLPGWTKQDHEILRQLLRNLRTNEEAFIIQTPNVEIDFAKVEGTMVNVLESAIHHNMMILLNVMAQFLALGVDGSGSGGGRATAGAHVDIFMKALRYIANYIAECINMYVIPELVVWNYPTKNFPTLKVRNIGETRDLQSLASAISNLFSQQGITNDLETENWLRKIFDMPAKKPNAVVLPQQELQKTQQPVDPSTNGQKGAIKPNGSKSGNTPAPANSAGAVADAFIESWLESEGLGHLLTRKDTAPHFTAQIDMPEQTHTHRVETPVTVENEYTFPVSIEASPAPNNEVHIDEGAVSLEPTVEVHNHIPEQPAPQIIHLKPKASTATKIDDKTTRIEYEYDDPSEV